MFGLFSMYSFKRIRFSSVKSDNVLLLFSSFLLRLCLSGRLCLSADADVWCDECRWCSV